MPNYFLASNLNYIFGATCKGSYPGTKYSLNWKLLYLHYSTLKNCKNRPALGRSLRPPCLRWLGVLSPDS